MKDFLTNALLATIIATLASGMMFWVRGLTLHQATIAAAVTFPLVICVCIYVMVVEPRLYARRRQREERQPHNGGGKTATHARINWQH